MMSDEELENLSRAHCYERGWHPSSSGTEIFCEGHFVGYRAAEKSESEIRLDERRKTRAEVLDLLNSEEEQKECDTFAFPYWSDAAIWLSKKWKDEAK